MKNLLFNMVGVILILGFFWGFLVICTIPDYDFLTKKNIEGRELCFHTDDGYNIRYYAKSFMGSHNRMGSFKNKNETLTDDFEKIGKDYRFFDNLKKKEKHD